MPKKTDPPPSPHHPSYESQKQYNDLKNEWYQKLKDEGFNDIEQNHEIQSNAYLKSWDSFYFQSYCRLHKQCPAHISVIDYEVFERKQEYYLRAYQFLTGGQFDTEIEKEIWHIHSDGFGIREIVKRIYESSVDHLPSPTNSCSAKNCSYSRHKVWLILKRLKRQMQTYFKALEEEAQE